MSRKRVLIAFGTRPEAIKLAPVIRELQRRDGEFETKVCVTGQHRHMLDQVMRAFGIRQDYDLDIMRKNQSPEYVTSRVVQEVAEIIRKEQSHVVIVQGDTITTFASALAAFYQQKKVAHVEAGLRTWNKFHPFPEEINRKLTSAVADFHFAPTEWAKSNLLREGYEDKDVYVVGNTVVDALMLMRAQNGSEKQKSGSEFCADGEKLILVTGHRRESFGKRFENICKGLRGISNRSDVQIVYSVHLNPNVREPVFRILANRKNIHLIEPLDYSHFIELLENCHLVLTDSGGIQEEAPTFGKPVLIMRDTSERPEGIEAGVAKLVGTSVETIVNSVFTLLDNDELYRKMQSSKNPYGDGRSAVRITDILRSRL